MNIIDLKLENLQDNAIKALVEKYYEDLLAKHREYYFALFELINKEYKETDNCPICALGHYRYYDAKIACNSNYFIIYDPPFHFEIQANYCPICGRKMGEE